MEESVLEVLGSAVMSLEKKRTQFFLLPERWLPIQLDTVIQLPTET